MKTKITLFFSILLFSIGNLKAQVTANTDNYTMFVNNNLSGASVLLNDTNVLGGPVTISILNTTSHGALLMYNDGAFYYTPTANFTGLDSFAYQVCDNSIPQNCDTATVYIQINACSTPIANAGPDLMVCQNTINLSASPANTGTGTWQLWSGGAAQIVDTLNPNSLFIAPPGTYVLVWIVNAGSCGSDFDQITIQVSPPIMLAINTTNASCNQCNGTATATVLGGNPPYIFNWNGGVVTTPFAQNLCAGNYNLFVADMNGCFANQNVVINSTSGLSLIVDSTLDAHCAGGPLGAIFMHANGGTAPYIYKLNGTIFPSQITGLAAGLYQISVTDSTGCTISQTLTINQAAGPTLVLDSLKNANCVGGMGALAVHASGTAGPYTYHWSPGNEITPAINNLSPGVYAVTVTDSAGCSSIHSYVISYFSNIYLATTAHPANCQNNGSINLSVYGAHPPFTYLWSDSLHQTTATATGLAPGNYSVLVQDSAGCQKTAYATIGLSCLNTIKGRIYIDLNGNCVQDSGETGIQGIAVYSSPGYYFGYTDSTGDYTISTPLLNNTIAISSSSIFACSNQLVCPLSGSLQVNFSQQGDTSFANNFAYSSIQGNFNLILHPGWNGASPGFSKHYWIYYYNSGPASSNAVITFVYDSSLIYNSSTLGGVHYPAQHKIEWNFSNVPASSIWTWLTKPEAFFTVPVSAGIHDSLCSYFEINPMVGDCQQSNNILSICEPISGSRDPNSKSVIPEGVGPNGNILATDSTLFYTIHFQNTGNDTAFTVVVTDTLSSFLDPSTIVPGAASHPYSFNLSGQGILNFRFDHILLPDSNVNEPESNGYVNYSIRQKANNPIGAVIENKAYIFFDFNEAVITNTVINTIVSSVGIVENSSSDASVQIFPNPFSDKTNFVIQSKNTNEVYAFELTDRLGKKVKSLEKINQKQFSISRNGLTNGIYFYKIYSPERLVSIGKLVID